jgi:hypothetical protein
LQAAGPFHFVLLILYFKKFIEFVPFILFEFGLDLEATRADCPALRSNEEVRATDSEAGGTGTDW